MRALHLTLLLLLTIGYCRCQVRYFGKALGALSSLQHGVRGELFAVDSRTLYIKDFYFDGEGPSAYFFVGTSSTPRAGAGSARLRDERGGVGPLRKYSGESITLTLPEGKTLKDYRWFSVYCEEYQVNFGDVSIPRGVEPPRPARVRGLAGAHGVHSDPIVVVDAQTLLVPHFSYDGEAPDAKFWVGRGDHPSPQGIRIPDENGKEVPLRRYNKKTIVLTLPGELTVFDIGHFGVWCEAFTVDFGHVSLPRAQLSNVPPSLKMLGVSPQSRNMALVSDVQDVSPQPQRRPRPPLVRLDATTYRPPALRPGASLLSSLQHDQHDHTNLHRRANTNIPQQQLVSSLNSRELAHREDSDNNFDQQQYQQQVNDYYEHQQEKEQLGSEPLTLEQHYQQQEDNNNQQEKQDSATQYQEEQQHSEPLTQEQLYQQQNKDVYQQQKDSQNQKQQQLPERLTLNEHYQQQQSYQQHDSQKEPTQQESPSLTIEQHYQQLLLQQQLLEKEIQQRQRLLQQAQEQLYYSQQPRNYQQVHNLPQSTESTVESLQQELYEQHSSEEPVQYRLLPY